VVAAVILAVSFISGGLRSAATSAVCIAIILFTGLWNDSMVTLATTLVATALVMALALAIGVLIARSRKADGVLRPILDAAQVMPPFVYLVPALGLFLATRFTAIVAAGHLRGAGRHQAGGRRHPQRVAHCCRGRRVSRVEHQPGHHQGPAPDGALGDRPGRQPGNACTSSRWW
jgi:hypothetical protein